MQRLTLFGHYYQRRCWRSWHTSKEHTVTIEQKLKGKDRMAVALGAVGLIAGICLGHAGTDMTYHDGFQAGQNAAWSHQGGTR